MLKSIRLATEVPGSKSRALAAERKAHIPHCDRTVGLQGGRYKPLASTHQMHAPGS